VCVYNVEEHGQGDHANGDGNGRLESVDDAKHDAKPKAIAES